MPTKRGRMPPTTGCLRSHASRRPTERHISPSTSFRGVRIHVRRMTNPSFGTFGLDLGAPQRLRLLHLRGGAGQRGGAVLHLRLEEAAEPRVRGKKEADFSASLKAGTTAGCRRDGSSASRQRSSHQNVCRSVLLDGENLFSHFINLYAASIVAGWAGVGAGVSGGSVPPLFSRLTGVYTERAGIPANRPFPHYWAV